MIKISCNTLDLWLKIKEETDFKAIANRLTRENRKIQDLEKFRQFVKQHQDKTQQQMADLDPLLSLEILQDTFTFLKIPTSIYNIVRKIVNSECIKILEEIGDVHANAGLRVLQNDLPISNNKENELRAVIIHFNSSLEMYIQATNKIQDINILSALSNVFSPPGIYKHFWKAFICSIFIAFCYKILNESELSRSYYKKARHYFYDYIWYSFNGDLAPHYEDKNCKLTSVELGSYPVLLTFWEKSRVWKGIKHFQSQELKFIELSKNYFNVPSYKPTLRDDEIFNKLGFRGTGVSGFPVNYILLKQWSSPT